MRNKYRSAIYYFREHQKEESINIIDKLQSDFKDKIITKTLNFKGFKLNTEEFQNYYQSNPEKPFCENYIKPKLKFLLKEFSSQINKSKVNHITTTI